MRFTLRSSLIAIVSIMGVGFFVVIVASQVITSRVRERLVEIEQRQIPRLELGPRIAADFTELTRTFQDAVAAQDVDALEEAGRVRDRIVGRLEKGEGVFDPAASAELRVSLEVYHALALDVSRRMIEGEGGEDIIEQVTRMQEAQARVQAQIDRVVAFDAHDLKHAFDDAYVALLAGARTRLVISLACLALVLGLSILFTRNFVRSLAVLHEGFARFGKGELDALIPVQGDDEIADVAAWANQMAKDLAALAAERERAAAKTRELLEQTRAQAARLQAQEEELRLTNEELQTQQEELRQANEELAEHARQLAEQRAQLEAKNEELRVIGKRLEQKAAELATMSAFKSQFLANMSHELRTPLNSMLLLSQLLADNEEGNLTPKQVEYARTVNGAGKDLLFLINQVLDLAKIEAGRQDIRIAPVRVEDVVDRVRRVFTPLAAQKGLSFDVTIADDVPRAIFTDGQRLGQILTNLVGNAVKFTSRGGVRLAVRRPDPSVEFRALRRETTIAFAVSDTGSGIAPEDQERIFEPFEQGDGAANRRHGGTGLGLAISRELATLLGGELLLESQPGEGSTFVCYLPEHRDPQEEERERSAMPAPERSAKPTPIAAQPGAVSTDPTHLLVIEDDPVFLEVLGCIIGERGLSWLAARDGTTGLRLARERRPSGIILDLELPDIDGWRVMEQLRADPATASIPVHVVSAVDAPERGLALGAVGYLTKPAEKKDLVRVVESLGRQRSAHRVLVVEDDKARGQTLAEQLTTLELDTRVVTSARDALDILAEESFACMIVDLSVPDIQELELLEVLQRRAVSGQQMPAVVLYTDRPLSRSEAVRFESYASVIVKEGASTERLLDEVRLFLRRLEAGMPRRSAPKQSVDVRLEGKKLLVVDDDMRTVYALSAALRAKGAEVLAAENGKVALELLDANPDVDAVLMDVMMPEMDGYEAMRRVRQQPRFERLPIVSLTAKAMKGDAERSIEAGASAYMPKPIDADALLSLLHTLFTGEEKR
jgi:signal transduction histidine kinase/CheY-like chemotaxis protein